MGEAGESNSVGVIGDSTFMHSGMTGITDISYNMSNSTVIILDNSITGMTGHQQNPTTGKNLRGEPAGKVDLEALCRALGFNRVRVVDPYDLAAVETAVTEELAAKEPSIIISRRPCVMIKGTVHKPAIAINRTNVKAVRHVCRLAVLLYHLRIRKHILTQHYVSDVKCASRCAIRCNRNVSIDR